MSSSDIFVGIDGTTPDWFNAVHFEETFDLPMSFVNCLYQASVAQGNRKHYFAGPDIGGFKTPACVSMPLMHVMDCIAAMPKPLLPRITIVGYSRGAYSAIRVAQALGKQRIPVYALLLLDTVKVTVADTEATIAQVIDRYDNSFDIEAEASRESAQIGERIRQSNLGGRGAYVDSNAIRNAIARGHGRRLENEIYVADPRDARRGSGNYVDNPGHFVVPRNVQHCMSLQRDFRLGSHKNVMGVAPVTFPGGDLKAPGQFWCSHSAMGGMPYRGDLLSPQVTPEGEWRECAKVADELARWASDLHVISGMKHPTLQSPRWPSEYWLSHQMISGKDPEIQRLRDANRVPGFMNHLP